MNLKATAAKYLGNLAPNDDMYSPRDMENSEPKHTRKLVLPFVETHIYVIKKTQSISIKEQPQDCKTAGYQKPGMESLLF